MQFYGRKKILNYPYVLKNGVGRYNIFFFIFTQSLLNPPFYVVFVQNPSMFLLVPCVFSSTNNFAHAQTLYRMSSLCRSYDCMNIARVNIGVLTGWKKIKQWRNSFVLGSLRMILWKISTAIRIKHRILATFNIKKKSILTACMPLKSIFFLSLPSISNTNTDNLLLLLMSTLTLLSVISKQIMN